MKIAIMGAGAIGGYVGGRLAQAGEDVHLIARGAHLAALREDGLKIESPHGDAVLPDIHATDDPADIGPADVVIFAVKLGDTDAAARALAPMVAADTRIVTLQNGIDSRAMIGRRVAAAQIAAGIAYLGAEIKGPGVISNPGGRHSLVVDALGGDPVMANFFAACGRAPNLDAEATDDIDHTVWHKFIALVAFSGVTTLTRCPIGAVYENPQSLAFIRALLAENLAIARACGQDFAIDHADTVVEFFGSQPYAQKSSMLIDLEAGKPLELPWLASRIVELGREHNVPTPANAAVVAALAPHVSGRQAG